MSPFQPIPNSEHNIQSKNYIMKKCTTEPTKVHLNSVMETVRNNSIMKNIVQIQNFRRNTGDLNNSKQTSSTILHFKKMPTNKKNRYYYHWTPRKQPSKPKELNLSLSLDSKTNLSLWFTKPDHCVESVRVWSFFLVRIFFPHLDWIWRLTQTYSPHLLRMWRNTGQTNPEC